MKRRLAALAILVTGAAAFAIVWWGSSSSGTGVITRALRAFGNGRVVHVVASLNMDPRDPAMQPIGSSESIEVWYDTWRHRTHAVLRRGTKVVLDSVEDVLPSYVPPVEKAAPLYEFVSGYRQALASGNYRVEKSAQVEGRHVVWLTASPLSNPPLADVAVDPDTYRPVWVRSGDPLTWLALVETKPYDPADFVPQSQRKARHL
jgi:hypothetical protein